MSLIDELQAGLEKRLSQMTILEHITRENLSATDVNRIFNQMKSGHGVPKAHNRQPGMPHIRHQFNIRECNDSFLVWIDEGEKA